MPALRLLTLNLRRDLADDGPNAWEGRRGAVARVLSARRPHVLATQEGLPHQLADLDRALPGHRRVGRDRRGDGTDEACALYVDDARLEILASGDFWLSDTPDVPGSATWGNRCPRMATWARLRDRGSGETFTVASTHLDHASEVARERGARLLADRLPGAFLLGDFNATPGEGTHRALLATGLRDAHLAAGAPERGTYHAYGRRDDARIDWVLVPAEARVLAVEVADERPDGRWTSDHHAVQVDVELAPVRVPVEAPAADAPAPAPRA